MQCKWIRVLFLSFSVLRWVTETLKRLIFSCERALNQNGGRTDLAAYIYQWWSRFRMFEFEDTRHWNASNYYQPLQRGTLQQPTTKQRGKLGCLRATCVKSNFLGDLYCAANNSPSSMFSCLPALMLGPTKRNHPSWTRPIISPMAFHLLQWMCPSSVYPHCIKEFRFKVHDVFHQLKMTQNV